MVYYYTANKQNDLRLAIFGVTTLKRERLNSTIS